MSQQGLRQASVRAVSGTTLSYEGDWHAMWDLQAIAAGTFNERMILYCSDKINTTFANINDAMQALAIDQGATNFGSMGTFVPTLGALREEIRDRMEHAPPINTEPPSLTHTTGWVGLVISCVRGTWTSEPTYKYQWQSDGVDILQAITSVHTVTVLDVGKVLTCVVTATNEFGSTEATSNECVVATTKTTRSTAPATAAPKRAAKKTAKKAPRNRAEIARKPATRTKTMVAKKKKKPALFTREMARKVVKKIAPQRRKKK